MVIRMPRLPTHLNAVNQYINLTASAFNHCVLAKTISELIANNFKPKKIWLIAT